MRYEYECRDEKCKTKIFTADKPLSEYKEPAKCPECKKKSPRVLNTPVPKSQSWSV